MKEKKPSFRHLNLLIISVVVVALLFAGWIVICHSGTTGFALGFSEGRSIAVQSPGVVLRQGGGGVEIRRTVANCAKGFVRRGSVCEVDTTQMALSAGSNVGQSSVRPPERQ